MNSYGENMVDIFTAPAMRGMRFFHAVIIVVAAVVAVAAATVAPFMATTPPVIS